LTFFALVQLPDHDAGFAAAAAVAGDTANAAIQTVLTFAGQLGICLVIAGLIRARASRVWPLVMVAAAIVIVTVFGMVLTTVVADILMLAASIWIAVRLGRSSRETWLGQSYPVQVQSARTAV
jgi:hypothetical protein